MNFTWCGPTQLQPRAQSLVLFCTRKKIDRTWSETDRKRSNKFVRNNCWFKKHCPYLRPNNLVRPDKSHLTSGVWKSLGVFVPYEPTRVIFLCLKIVFITELIQSNNKQKNAFLKQISWEVKTFSTIQLLKVVPETLWNLIWFLFCNSFSLIRSVAKQRPLCCLFFGPNAFCEANATNSADRYQHQNFISVQTSLATNAFKLELALTDPVCAMIVSLNRGNM